MTTPNILRDTTPTISAADPMVATCVITDAWGLVFAQGGVVMAAALRAMEAVLHRPDLSLTAASATFCKPVPCGPVTIRVQVLRDGRRGAQVHAAVEAPGGGPAAPNVVLTAVFTDPGLEGPVRAPLPFPPELNEPPGEAELGVADHGGREFPLGFLDNTEWRVAAAPSPNPTGAPRLPLWFRFSDAPAAEGAAWDPALLPIPGDSLGSALSVALSEGEAPVGSVSLQIGLQVFAPVVGRWIGVESIATNLGSGLANGMVHLWSEGRAHVATVTQTAMLRSFGPPSGPGAG